MPKTLKEAVDKPVWVDDDRRAFRFGDYIITGTNKEHARIAFQAAVAYSEEGREEEYAKVKAGRWSVAGRPVRIRKSLGESFILNKSLLPLCEIYPHGPTRMEVQRQYEAQRQSGQSVQQAIRNLEDIFDIYKVSVDSSGKTIVNFKINEDAFTDALSKFTGIKFDACPRCGELLAHRGGKPLPCTNVKCPEKGKPVSEGRRAEDEKDWIAHNPGFQFGVYAKGKLLSVHPSIPYARREARKHVKQGLDIRIKDVKKPDRSYWHEEDEHLNESAPPGSLLAALQKEIPNVRTLRDVTFDAEALKFELSVARRIKDAWISVAVDGKRITLPLAQGEELLKQHQADMRSIKKYVRSRW